MGLDGGDLWRGRVQWRLRDKERERENKSENCVIDFVNKKSKKSRPFSFRATSPSLSLVLSFAHRNPSERQGKTQEEEGISLPY